MGTAPDQPMAQNNVALAQRHRGVRNRGIEQSVAAPVTIVVIFSLVLAFILQDKIVAPYPSRIQDPVLPFTVKPIICARVYGTDNKDENAIKV